MSFYTTSSRMLRNIPELGSLTTMTTDVLEAFADDAGALINGKLASLYTVPVSGSPLLELLATDIALYYSLRRAFTQEKTNASEWPDKYKEAMVMLDQIAAGQIQLVNSAGTLISATGQGGDVWSSTMDYVPTFAEDDPETNYRDQNKLDYIDSTRD